MADKPMNKSQLLNYLAEKSGQSRKDITAMLDLIVQTAYGEARRVGELTLPDLGKFVKKQRTARTGRNPATGAEIQIPAKTVVKFRVAKAAKDAVLG
ncbi:MAG: HU family DNA-binding protein [Candidatus Kerfeldbacteria bacterium]|nr:HU family DNA-binding protein [Candidatus Kerfeldbacteria bacterium]